MAKPQAKTIIKVVEHLNSLGLEVFGPNVDLADGQQFEGLKTFSAKEVVAYRYLVENAELWRDEQ